jgi:hypothetical protein
MRAFLILCLTALGLNSNSHANSSPDFFPERLPIEPGKTLLLNGIGTRTATLFAIKVYHAAFYSDRSIKNLDDALTAPNPKRLDIRYVRDFDLKETSDAWVFQFHESAGIEPPALEREIKELVSFQKAIRKGDVHRFDFEDGKTIFSINDERRGEIEGAPFQKALLTLFFGPNPPTKDLQRGLTRGVLIGKDK